MKMMDDCGFVTLENGYGFPPRIAQGTCIGGGFSLVWRLSGCYKLSQKQASIMYAASESRKNGQAAGY
jgi:hypothetical protein